MKKQLSTYPLRLPASLKAAVVEISGKDGTSINQFVTTAVAEKIAAMKTAEFFTACATQADVEGWRAGCCAGTVGSPRNPRTGCRDRVSDSPRAGDTRSILAFLYWRRSIRSQFCQLPLDVPSNLINLPRHSGLKASSASCGRFSASRAPALFTRAVATERWRAGASLPPKRRTKVK